MIFEAPNNPNPGYPGVSIDDPNAPANVEIDYTTQPIITIQPKRAVRPGVIIPEGLIAHCPVYKPTPAVKISARDIISAEPGDETMINGTSVTVPGGGYQGFLNGLMCEEIPGVNITNVVDAGVPYVKVSSCSNAPLTFRNGCAAGGRYKEIMDFHVVRNFTDSQDAGTHKNTTNIPSYNETRKEYVTNAANPDYDPRPTIEETTTDSEGNVVTTTVTNPNFDNNKFLDKNV